MAKETNMTGDNSGVLNEDEQKSLFFTHLRKREKMDAKIKAAQADKKAAGKLAQADGLVLAELDYASKAINAEDKASITDRFGAFGKILGWLGLLPGFEPDLFLDRAPAIERIEGEGELAGLAARERTSPYADASDEQQAWLRGYDRGQGIVRDNFSKAMKKLGAGAAKKAANDELIKPAEDPFDDEPANENQAESDQVAAE